MNSLLTRTFLLLTLWKEFDRWQKLAGSIIINQQRIYIFSYKIQTVLQYMQETVSLIWNADVQRKQRLWFYLYLFFIIIF